MADSPELVLEDSEDIPSGRKARKAPEWLLKALHDSATRGKAKLTQELSPSAVAEFRKVLGAAEVKAKYIVTTETRTLENGMQRLKFAATRKTQPQNAKAASK